MYIKYKENKFEIKQYFILGCFLSYNINLYYNFNLIYALYVQHVYIL